MFRKTALIVTMLVAAAQIHPETARSKLLRTDKKSPTAKPPSVRPHPACAVLIYLLVTSARRRARVSRASISKLSSN